MSRGGDGPTPTGRVRARTDHRRMPDHPLHRSHAPGSDARTFRSRLFRRHRSPAQSIELPTAGLRLRQLGFAAISDHLLGRFDYMKGHSSQRGGAKGPTHAIVYRFIMTIWPTVRHGPNAGSGAT